MTETEILLTKRVDALEAMVASLLHTRTNKKPESERITPAEIAAKFGVSDRTVRNMENDFAFLYPIHQKTGTGRIFWLRKDYENALRKREAKKKGLIRR